MPPWVRYNFGHSGWKSVSEEKLKWKNAHFAIFSKKKLTVLAWFIHYDMGAGDKFGVFCKHHLSGYKVLTVFLVHSSKEKDNWIYVGVFRMVPFFCPVRNGTLMQQLTLLKVQQGCINVLKIILVSLVDRFKLLSDIPDWIWVFTLPFWLVVSKHVPSVMVKTQKRMPNKISAFQR